MPYMGTETAAGRSGQECDARTGSTLVGPDREGVDPLDQFGAVLGQLEREKFEAS